MTVLPMQVVEHDRGLGTAYERWCFYQLMQQWAARYGVESALEGPVDGMAGVRGVHCVGLARDGVRVVSAVTSPRAAELARAVYGRAAPHASVDVRVVAATEGIECLPASDLVLVYHALPFVGDWRAYLRRLAGLARKVLVVATCNPQNWGFLAVRLVGGVSAPEVWQTGVLAPALWEIGRVRDHVYFDAPWWPDLPVAPGQSVADRLKQMFTVRGGARFAPPEEGAVLAAKYVYGPERWPYFGGEGWLEELQPALLRHPAFEGSRSKIIQRMAHLHAFVVDVSPRTPQARRRLEVMHRAAGDVGVERDPASAELVPR
ncbi:MAG TPA: hypothetical protein VEK07_16845 [Polyangiaceae bacterium]|nr:hypothetical protein [Polyangiaceae bacterium]